jgi:hypothetical protein
MIITMAQNGTLFATSIIYIAVIILLVVYIGNK